MLLSDLKYQLKKSYRQGRRYRQHYEEIANTIHGDLPEIRNHQEQQIKRLLRHCYDKVPFYHQYFKELNLNPSEIQSLQDFSKLPVIDKQFVKTNQKLFHAKSMLSLLNRKGYSSGTTGTPISIVRNYNSINYENAAVWHYWNHVGDNECRRITLRGEIIHPAEQDKPPFWKYNPANHELLMSSYHLSLENADLFIEQILDFKPEILYCYPSTGALLAKIFRQKNIQHPFKAVFTSSECLETETLSLMENTFGCKVYDWYGQAERVAAIFRCPEGAYHIHESYSYVELIPSLENPGYQELIGSNLNNYAMPLLRYKTNDLVKMEPKGFQCPCGSHFRVVKELIGRKPNYIVTPENRYIGNATANILKGLDEVLEVQFYQDSKESLKLIVVPNITYSAKTREQLEERVKRFTSPRMQVEIEEVEAIERGPNGKFVSLISKIT